MSGVEQVTGETARDLDADRRLRLVELEERLPIDRPELDVFPRPHASGASWMPTEHPEFTEHLLVAESSVTSTVPSLRGRTPPPRPA